MADPSTCPPLTRDSVLAAHELIKPYVHHTPVLTNATLSTLASTRREPDSLAGTPWEGRSPAEPKMRLWFKCENLQRTGAFKARGAFHAIERLKREPGWLEGGGAERGVVTHSSGNHAQALALAARTSNIAAHVVMPRISAAPKIAATRGYGADVTFSGSTSEEREVVTARVVRATGARLVPPYDHPDVVLGQGTLGLELQRDAARMMTTMTMTMTARESGGAAEGREKEQGQKQDQVPAGHLGAAAERCSFAAGSRCGDGPAETTGTGSGTRRQLDAIVAPCGGGGMLSGVALSCDGTGIRVFGAEPSAGGADDARRGFETGRRVERVASLTVADGLRTPVGLVPWDVMVRRRLVAGFYSVTEAEITDALRLVLERFKMVIEPSAAVALAVALYNEDFRAVAEREGGPDGWDVGVVLSGGNVSLEALGKLFSEA